MDDATPAIREKVRELIQAKNPAERLLMGCSMHETSLILVSRALHAEFPHMTEVDFRQQLFLRFYGNDYETPEREKIMNYLASFESSPGLARLFQQGKQA